MERKQYKCNWEVAPPKGCASPNGKKLLVLFLFSYFIQTESFSESAADSSLRKEIRGSSPSGPATLKANLAYSLFSLFFYFSKSNFKFLKEMRF